MGKAVLGVCFDGTTDDLAAAAQHVCDHLFPSVTSAGVVQSCTGLGSNVGNGKVLILGLSSGGTSTAGQRVVTPSNCDALTFRSGPGPWDLPVSDAAAVGAAVLAVWLLAVAWRSIRRALGDHNGSDD